MAIIKKSEMKKMSASEVDKKLQELEMSIVTLRSEGLSAKTKVVRKTIAKLKTLKHIGLNSAKDIKVSRETTKSGKK